MTLDARLTSLPSALPPVPAPYFRLRVRTSRGETITPVTTPEEADTEVRTWRREVLGTDLLDLRSFRVCGQWRAGDAEKWRSWVGTAEEVLALPGDRRAVHCWWHWDVGGSGVEVHASLEAARHASRQFSRSMGGSGSAPARRTCTGTFRGPEFCHSADRFRRFTRSGSGHDEPCDE